MMLLNLLFPQSGESRPPAADAGIRMLGQTWKGYPCRCECLLLTQMMRTLPLRRIIRQRSQRGFTDADTFIVALSPHPYLKR